MDWTRGLTIGRGSSATVSVAKVNCSGQLFAVKSAEVSQSESLVKEQSILSTLSCPHVVAYEGCDVTNENGKVFYNLFMEYVPGGSLIDAIRERGGCLDEGLIRSYARTILLGVEHLHSNGIVHCDIKGHNILVTGGGGAKIADLGCARRVDEVPVSVSASIAGTPLYMAPEVARGEHQGFAADIWAVGCTIVEMATGQAPWVNISDPISALYQIGFSGSVPEIPSFMSKQGKDFLSKCLKRDPMERWSASELLKHEFINVEEQKESINGASNVDTPTTVLDQGLWNSMEELVRTWDLTHRGSLVSPIERISQLITEGSAGNAPDWSLDDDAWVTIRSNSSSKEEEMAGSSHEEHNSADASEPIGNSGTGVASVGMEFDFVIHDEQPTSIGGNNNSTNSCKTSNSDSCRGDGSGDNKISLMPCESTNDASSRSKFRFCEGNRLLFSTWQCSILYHLWSYRHIIFLTIADNSFSRKKLYREITYRIYKS